MRYAMIIEKGERNFSAYVPDLPGCIATGKTLEEVKRRVDAFNPEFLVIPTAPSYLFWRCPPPELRVPMDWLKGLDTRAKKVLIGPHPSATPAATLRKTGCDVALRGEPDQTIPELAGKPWDQIAGCCFNREDGGVHKAWFNSATTRSSSSGDCQ